MKILQACAMGFVVIGFIGYIIKLVFIPINNIILGAWLEVVTREMACSSPTSLLSLHKIMLSYWCVSYNPVFCVFASSALKDIYLSRLIRACIFQSQFFILSKSVASGHLLAYETLGVLGPESGKNNSQPSYPKHNCQHLSPRVCSKLPLERSVRGY